jgi:hypothetical protein
MAIQAERRSDDRHPDMGDRFYMRLIYRKHSWRNLNKPPHLIV